MRPHWYKSRRRRKTLPFKCKRNDGIRKGPFGNHHDNIFRQESSIMDAKMSGEILKNKRLTCFKVSPHKTLIYFNGQNNFIMEHSLRCHFHQMTITGITKNRTNQHVFPAVMHWEFHMASVIFLLNCITWTQT